MKGASEYRGHTSFQWPQRLEIVGVRILHIEQTANEQSWAEFYL